MVIDLNRILFCGDSVEVSPEYWASAARLVHFGVVL